MADPFGVGDKVQCFKARGVGNLTRGKMYDVVAPSGSNDVTIINDAGQYVAYARWRFESLENQLAYYNSK